MSPPKAARTSSSDDETPEESPAEKTQKEATVRIERATIGINVIGGIALALLLAMVADMRSSIANVSSKVDSAIRDVAILQASRLEERMRDCERQITVNTQRLATLEKDSHPRLP